MRRLVLSVLLAAALCAAEADPLTAALKGQDGDVFAADRIQEVLLLAPRTERAALVRRIADSGRDDVYGILHRLVQDEDPASAAIAIDALAKRWPTGMQDVELIRTLLLKPGQVGAAASRYAAVVGDDEALPALVERTARFPLEADADAALRKLIALPGGCGPQGWSILVEARMARQEAAISGAERMLGGTPAEAMGALTLVAGMRPPGSRGARVLLAAVEHPDRAVRSMAVSILGTCEAPAAAVWRNREAADPAASPMATVPGPQGFAGAVSPPIAPAASQAAAAPAAASSAAAGGNGWIWLVGAIGLLGGGGWLLTRRRPTAAPDVAPVAPRKERLTWVR